MACINCKRIRDAILHGRMAEAAGVSVEVLREKIGWNADVAPVDQPTIVVGGGPAEIVVPEKPKGR